jgi:ABC-2 type transport system ATP-binding protein
MSTFIEARQLSKWFGEVMALNNVDLVIEEGVTGLLGPNGAGKSTFIKLALGLYSASRGHIHVCGAPPRNNLKVLRDIGYCPEVDKFYENLTGYEFVYWMNRYWGMPRRVAKEAALEACDLVHMTERMDDPIDEYSKGMRQRIKLAQALATRPKVLFLDEPMSGLDPQGREEMYALIRGLGAEGCSVVVSSHILYEIERVTDNVVLLYNGTVLAQGRVRQIRDLIDEHPHTITIESADPRALSRHFVDDPAVMHIEFEDGKVTMRTRDPNRCYQRINDLAVEGAADVRCIRCADDNLQSVFDYLTK